MKLIKIVFLLLLANHAIAQYTPVVHATWEAVTTESDGTVVDRANFRLSPPTLSATVSVPGTETSSGGPGE